MYVGGMRCPAGVCAAKSREGISFATFYKYNSKYGGVEPSDAKRLRALEDENGKLKKLLADGRRFRILAVVDDYSRENLALTADTSLSGHRVARELDRIIAERGMPNTLVSDNGTEFTSIAILKWVQATGVDWHYIAPRSHAWKHALPRIGQAPAERLHRKLQRQATGRMPQSNAVRRIGGRPQNA